MTAKQLGPGERTKVRRLPKKASYDEAVVHAIIDEARLCHVAANVDGMAMTLPNLHAREGSTLYLHGSQSNAVMKAVAAAGTACVSMTLYDGLRLARSGFESSIGYRSVVLFGAASTIEDDEEKARVLDLFVDRILPGRAAEVRPMTQKELNLTLVVAIEIEEASAKISAGQCEDFPEDLDLPIWAGVVPAKLTFSSPIPASDGAMSDGTIALPDSVKRLLEQQ